MFWVPQGWQVRSKAGMEGASSQPCTVAPEGRLGCRASSALEWATGSQGRDVTWLPVLLVWGVVDAHFSTVHSRAPFLDCE